MKLSRLSQDKLILNLDEFHGCRLSLMNAVATLPSRGNLSYVNAEILPSLGSFLNLGAIFIRGRVAKLQIPRRWRLADQALNGAASRPFGKDTLSQSVARACEYLEGWACTKIEEESD